MQHICDEFAQGSGQIFNTLKSVTLVSKPLDEMDTQIVSAYWNDCKLVREHKIAGVMYSIHVRPEDGT